MPPSRKVPIHERNEAIAMAALYEVNQLMHYHIFETVRRLLRQLEI